MIMGWQIAQPGWGLPPAPWLSPKLHLASPPLCKNSLLSPNHPKSPPHLPFSEFEWFSYSLQFHFPLHPHPPRILFTQETWFRMFYKALT